MSRTRHLIYRPAFGRRAVPLDGSVAVPAPVAINEDVKLFALTFLGGFLFMTVYLA